MGPTYEQTIQELKKMRRAIELILKKMSLEGRYQFTLEEDETHCDPLLEIDGAWVTYDIMPKPHTIEWHCLFYYGYTKYYPATRHEPPDIDLVDVGNEKNLARAARHIVEFLFQMDIQMALDSIGEDCYAQDLVVEKELAESMKSEVETILTPES